MCLVVTSRELATLKYCEAPAAVTYPRICLTFSSKVNLGDTDDEGPRADRIFNSVFVAFRGHGTEEFQRDVEN